MVADPTTGRPQRADADVIVVGAGPAGSTAATYLARAGPGRAAAGEVHLPAREGLRRRLHPARHQAAHRPRHRHPRGGRLAAQPRPARARRRGQHRARLADARELPGLRRRPHRGRTSTSCSSGTPSSRAPGCTRTPRSPTRRPTSAPAASSGSRGHVGRGKDKRAGHATAPRSPLACDGVSRPARAERGHRQARRPADGRRRPPLLPQPADARRLPGEPPGAVGPLGPGEPQAPARLRLDLRDGRRHGRTSASASCPPAAPTGPPTTGPCCAAGWTARPRSGASARRTPTGAIGGAALPMGFNRTPHYRPGLLLVGRRGRAWSTRSTARASPTRWSRPAIASRCAIQALARPAAPPRRRRWRATRWRCGRRSAATTASATSSPSLIGNPTVMGLATRHGLPRRTLMEFLLKLLANLYDPKDGDDERPRDHRDGAARPERVTRWGEPPQPADEVRLAWLRPGGRRDLGSRRRPDSRRRRGTTERRFDRD